MFWPRLATGGIMVPPPGIEPVPPEVEAWCLNHWTSREVPIQSILKGMGTCVSGRLVYHEEMIRYRMVTYTSDF